MKNLIDYILESTSISNISIWIAKAVNKSVNGINIKTEKVKCLKDFQSFALQNCKEMTQDEIGEMIESQQGIYVIVQPMDNKYLSMTLYSDEFEIFLSPAHTSVKKSNKSKYTHLGAVDFAFILPYEETIEILQNVKWPDEKAFTNVSDKNEFIEDLEKFIK